VSPAVNVDATMTQVSIRICARRYGRRESAKAGVTAATVATSTADCGPDSSSDVTMMTNEGAMIARSFVVDRDSQRTVVRIAARTRLESSMGRAPGGQPASCGRDTAQMNIARTAIVLARGGTDILGIVGRRPPKEVR